MASLRRRLRQQAYQFGGAGEGKLVTGQLRKVSDLSVTGFVKYPDFTADHPAHIEVSSPLVPVRLIAALAERDLRLRPWTFQVVKVSKRKGQSFLIFSCDEDAVLARLLVEA